MKSENHSLKDVVRPGPSRGLDFVVLDELNRRTGIEAKDVLSFGLSELLCNALDKHDATEINVDVQTVGEFDVLTVSDNGKKKFERSDLELIVDFENKASSKRWFLQISRGYLGNALKCLFGYSYALAELRGLTALPITVSSGAFEYQIRLKPDKIGQVIESEITQTERNDDGFTLIKVGFPVERDREISKCTKALRLIIFATSMVNPSRKLCFNLYGNTDATGTGKEGKEIRQETSALWYTSKQFIELFQDFVRAVPGAQLKGFIAMFRGFSGRKAILEVLNEARKNYSVNVDSRTVEIQFLPTTPLKAFSDQAVKHLFSVMKTKSKLIEKRSIPSVLGCVGETAFKKIQEEHGWLPRKRPYILLKGLRTSGWPGNIDYVQSPYLVELTVFDRKDDGEGLQVFQCVNFMASTREVLSETFNVRHHLGLVRISDSTPITIIVHIVSPVLPWLNYGKTSLGNIDTCDLIEQAFDKLLPIPESPREYIPPPPPRPLSWIPHGKLGDPLYESRLQAFAAELKVIDSQRTYPIKPGSRGWCYLIEEHGKIDKGEFDACQKAINDCRKIGLLSMDFVAEDQDETRHFRGIHRASNPIECLRQMREDVAEMRRLLPSKMTYYWKGEKYFLIMVVEKYEILNLADQVNREYHLPSASSKGWATLHVRNNIAKLCKWAESQGLIPVLFLFYDLDFTGWKITNKFRKNLKDMERGTHWNPDKLIIERIGLNKEDIEKYDLTWIDNLKTSSGREPRPGPSLDEYGRLFGHKKCEANSLFKSDETLRAAEQIFRNAIEKWLGSDAKERFKKKEQESTEILKQQGIYDDPVWENFDVELTRIEGALADQEPKKTEATPNLAQEQEVEVIIDGKYYGKCPKCGAQFNYDEERDNGRLVRCRNCNQAMRLKTANGAS